MVSLSILTAWSSAEQKVFVFPFHFNEGKEAHQFALTGSPFRYFWEAMPLTTTTPTHPVIIYFPVAVVERSRWQEFEAADHITSRIWNREQWVHVETMNSPAPTPGNGAICREQVFPLEWTQSEQPSSPRYAQSSFSQAISDSVRFSIDINCYDTQAFPHTPRVSSGF